MLALISGALNAQNYIPDVSFSDDGYLVTDYFQYYDNTQPPGTVLTVGDKYIFSQKTQLCGFNADGTIDYTFGTMGYSRIISGNLSIQINGSKLIDGSIFVYGKAYMTNDFNAFVVKMDPAGHYDTTFGNNGMYFYHLNGGNYTYGGVSDFICKDNNFYVMGEVPVSNNKKVFVTKLDLNGNPVNAFGVNGMQAYDYFSPSTMAPYGDGLLIMGTTGGGSSGYTGILMKIDESGNLDAGFGSNGQKKILLTGPCTCGSSMYNCSVVGNDMYFIVRYASISDNIGTQKLMKVDLTALPPLNDLESTVFTHIGSNNVYNFDSLNYMIDNDRVYRVESYNGFKISRYLTNGSPDTTFNQTGFYAFDFPASPTASIYLSVLAKTGDKIVLGGYKRTPGITTAPATGLAVLKITDAALSTAAFGPEKHFTVSPNPFSNMIAINNPDQLTIEKIVMTDVMGKMVYTQDGSLESINAASLQTGMYMLQVYSKDRTEAFKMIKN